MNMRCVPDRYVTPSWYAPLALALLVAGGSACADDARLPEGTEPPADGHRSEATVKPSEPPVAAVGDATPEPKIVEPADAVEFPRAIALKQARHVTIVDHENAAPASSDLAGGAQ
jgi:hypothetical protein